MIERLQKFTNRLIWLSFVFLAVVTPLLFSTRNTELFEVPKMLFVYSLAIVLFFLTLLKFVLSGKLKVPTNWVVIVFALFIIAQAVSTFFSIDKFTSVFGYPSRLNGGLLSQIAYLVIFTTALINLDIAKAKKLLVAMVMGALAVSLWGIPGHFGRDPSCYVLSGKFTSSCWQKEFDPTIRIFSTLGQPNWLASYLLLLLPIALAFFLYIEKRAFRLLFLTISILLLAALVMTTSRAGLLGLAFSFVSFFFLLQFKLIKKNFKWISIFAVGFLAVLLLFGGFLFARISEALNKNQSPQTKNQQIAEQLAVAPETGGTESSIIRLIVWKGAIDSFKKRPVLGFGPETFAYSYYLYRPLEHNKTTEWNFFYNKAHNEFLNYLAGVGAAGATLYVTFLLATLLTFYKLSRVNSPRYSFSSLQERSDYKLAKTSKEETTIFLAAGFSSVLGYQISIFFGFSTVASQTLMYLLIATLLIYANAQKVKTFDIKFLNNQMNPPRPNGRGFFFSRKIRFISILKDGVFCLKIKYPTILILIIIGLTALTMPLRFYFADLFLLKAKETTSGDISKALANYSYATSTFPFKNPFYLSDFAYATAIYATSFEDKNTSNKFAQRSEELSEFANMLAPNNLIIARRVANAYFILSDVNDKYKEKAQAFGNKLTQLAPTDPQSYLALAQIEAGVNKTEDARETLTKALNLKPDYQEAKELMEQLGN